MIFKSALVVAIALLGPTMAVKRIVGDAGFGNFDISNIIDKTTTSSTGSIVSSGFVATQNDMNTPFTIHIKKRINRPGICNTIQLVDTPQPNYSPLVGSSKLTIDLSKMVNDHYSYTNGQEYLSYITSDNEYGNWLMGNAAGVDSGYVYLTTSEIGSIPVNQENAKSKWQWLQKGKWVEFPEMKVICADSYYAEQSDSERHYFTIEYFDPVTNEPEHSILVPDFNPFLFDKQEGTADNELNYKVPAKIAKKTTDGKFAAYLNKRTNKWVLLHSFKTIATMGSPVMVTDTTIPQEHVCVLVKEEHGGTNGWRLSFKHASQPYKAAANPYHQVTEEFLVEVNNLGVEPRYRLSEMTSSLGEVWWAQVAVDLSLVKVGDYFWTWLSPIGGGATVHTTSIFEALIKCVAVREETVGGKTFVTSLFEYYDSDRGEVLRQTLLSRDTELVQIRTVKPDSKNSKYVAPTIQYQGVSYQLHSSRALGSDILSFIRSYLVNKEGQPHGMSSCYMYHAAVSLPQALVYAAEIVCVLIGAKPLTMIQYTSSSESQWKFPLVRELSQAIIASKNLLGDQLDVKYEVFKYNKDESLIIYRTNRTWVAETLIPFKQAQALHPLPYPDTSRLFEDNKLQIYNSAWNGYALGYPDYFVESYCETFHNTLDIAEKKRQAKDAKRKFDQHLASIKREKFQIKMGLEKPIEEGQFGMIAKLTYKQ